MKTQESNPTHTARPIFLSGLATLLMVVFLSCGRKIPATPELTEVFSYNPRGEGMNLSVEFTRGPAHNHPLMAIWIEDEEGIYIQTLFVAESIGKGVFRYGQTAQGKWMPGEIRRPASLPYWAHKRGIRARDGLFVPDPENPVPDAFTGPTPAGNFIMHFKTDQALPSRFRILFEINQTWDWNEFWTNNKYPDDQEYKTSSQPALVYAAPIDTNTDIKEYNLKPIGRSHHSGKTGDLYNDVETLTTALKIANQIIVKVNN